MKEKELYTEHKQKELESLGMWITTCPFYKIDWAHYHVTESIKNQPVSPQASTPDYAGQVESLQLQVSEYNTLASNTLSSYIAWSHTVQIAQERQAITKVISERRGRIPLSVCYNLEQCLREVEVGADLHTLIWCMNVSFQIETQKCQRHSEHLRKEIEVSCCILLVPVVY